MSTPPESRIPVGRIISATGFKTTLGGGTLPEVVRLAMQEASSSTFQPDRLQAWAGEAISEATGSESGWITAGAAAGITMATAACIAGKGLAAMEALPAPTDPRAEIIIQRGHRNSYDRAFRNAGARLVEVGFPHIEGIGLTYEWQLEAAFTERTVAVAHVAIADDDGVPLERVCEIASAHGVPVIVDAAAELPPVSNLRRFVEAGAAVVTFSGGKAIRGPQGSGIFAARRDIVESVRLQTLDMDVDVARWVADEGGEPPHHGMGRTMKIGNEQIVGAVVALQEFVRRDHEAESAEQRRWLEDDVVPAVAGLGEATVRADMHFYPRLVVSGMGSELARDRIDRLANGTPSIIVAHAPQARGELVVLPEAIAIQDRVLVQEALAALPR
ncbi:MAG TPA: aminotransferase class V-fold PLP-dependent enzyme [Gaiellaceae bacterium]|jgi:L-seryl-tRNA(Ser) seleniumtransferase|nr:aminotransferase class V-fold PLP-dependent enzyme [Gaiellaceae bacterium]